MKKVILIFGIVASLTSCKKESNFIYKYSYTTEQSNKANRITTSLANYDHLLTPSEIEAERIIIRESKNTIVLTDTLILTNY